MPTNTRQRPQSKMSVAKYVKNVGKSLALAGIDVTMENAPAMKEFLQANDEYIKKGFAYIKNPRSMTDKADRQSTLSRVYQSIGTGLKNFKDDVLSGNLYNDAKAQQAMDEQFGAEMGFDMDSDNDDFNWSEDGGKTSSTGTSAVSDSFGRAIGAAATSNATAVAQGTELVIGANKASTKLVIANMDKLGVNISAGLASVYSNISITNKSIQTHVENSNKFYEATNNLLREQVALMRELVDIQRRIYVPQTKKSGGSSLRSAMDAHGNINLEGYIKNIQKNLNNNFGYLGINFGDNDPNDPFNPINIILNQLLHPSKEITKMFMRAITPKDFKNSVRSMDQALSSLFSQLIAAINKEKFKGGPLGALATIFGIGVDNKTNIKTSEYKKDAIPFDGITKQAIIETIPGYLARIEAALTGSGNARYYDYEQGRWTDYKTIAKEYKDARKRAVTSANFGIYSDTIGLVNKTTSSNAAAGAKLQRQIESMMNQIYADGGYFRLDKINDMPAWQYYQFDSEKTFKAVTKNLSKETIRSLARKNMQSREDFSNRMRGKEGASAIERQLFNNSHGSVDMSISGGSAKSGLVKGTGLLSLSYDEQGKNVFYYLREILSRMDHRPAANASGGARSRHSRKRNKKSRSTTTASSGDSDGDPDPEPPSEDDDEGLGDTIEQISKELAEEAEKSNRLNTVSKWFKDTLDKSPIGEFVHKFGVSFGKILSSPINYMTKMLDKADKSLFKIMFGESELKDADGKPINSVFDHIIKKVSESFDKIKESIGKFFKETIGDKLKNFLKPVWDKFGAPVWNEVKGYTSKGVDRVKDAMSNTFGKAFYTARYGEARYQQADEFAEAAAAATGGKARDIRREMVTRKMTKDQWQEYSRAMRKAKNGQVASADEVTGSASPADIMDPGVIASNAFGTRYVTKRGLTMISPGEMIIPATANSKELNNMLAMEKQDRNRILNTSRRAGYIGLNAKGTIDIEKLKESLFKIYDENKSGVVKTAAGGVLGAGAGLLTGINPLLGAVAGAGISILNNSQTLQKIVFGEDTEDGHVGGIIPKKIQDYFKKAGGDAIDFGVAGGILGLVTGMGPLAGAAVGAGIGFLKNSETVNKVLFGEDGIIGEENKEKISKFIKKATPNALVGAGIGILTGPFGLLGNAALGAGLGLITSTNTFHDLMFGKEDDPDDKGIFGSFKEGMLNPAIEKMKDFLEDMKDFAKKHIFDNLKKFFDPFSQMVKNTITNVGTGIKDYLNDMFERTVGIPIADWMREKLFKPLTKVMGGLLKIPVTLGKAAINAPFAALGWLANNMRQRQIEKGTAYNMTAEERLQWRKDHKVRSGVGRFFGRDNMEEQDTVLANMDEEQLKEVAALTKGQLTSREELGKNLGQNRKQTQKDISKFFNKKNKEGKSLYDSVGVKNIQKLTKLAAEGDMTGFNNQLKKLIDKGKLTSDQVKELNDLVSSNITAVKSSMDAIANYDMDRSEKNMRIAKALGRNVNGRKDMRHVMKAAEAELKMRKRRDSEEYDPEEAAEEQAKSREEATEGYRKYMKSKIDEIIENLKSINSSTQAVAEAESDGNIAPARIEGATTVPLGLPAPKEIETAASTGVIKALPGGQNGWFSEGAYGDMATLKSEYRTLAKKYHPDINRDNDTTETMQKINAEYKSMLEKIKGKHNEDSIEAKEANEKVEEANKTQKLIAENTGKTAEHTGGLFSKLFGKFKDKKDKSDNNGGFLGAIKTGLGSFFSLFGIKGSTIAKIGLGAVALGAGVSFFGSATDWFKNKVWPTIKGALFGTQDSSSGDYSGGLLSGLANKYNAIMYGDGTAENPGLVNKIKLFLLGDGSEANPGLVGKLLNGSKKLLFGDKGSWDNPTGGLMGWLNSGGLYKFIGDKVLPKLFAGFGMAMNYIVTPLTALIVKNLPAILSGLGSAIISGIKMGLGGKQIVRNPEITTDLGEFQGIVNNTGSKLASNAGLDQSSTKVFSGINNSSIYSSASSTIDINSIMDPNYIAAEDAYDKDGNHLNKASTEVMYKKAPGLAGLLGAKQSTNTVVYDEYGNNALYSYDQMNTQDSIGSRIADVTGRGFVRGLGGYRTGSLFNKMAKVSAKGSGKGVTKVTTGLLGGAAKVTGKTVNAGNNAGLKLNEQIADVVHNQLSYSNSIDDAIKSIIDARGLSDDEAKIVSKQLKKAFKSGGSDAVEEQLKYYTSLGANVADSTTDNMASGVSKAISNMKNIEADGYVSNATTKAAKQAAKEAATNSTDEVVEAGTKALATINNNAVAESAKVVANASDNVAAAGAKAAAESTDNLAAKAINGIKNAADNAGGAISEGIKKIFKWIGNSKIMSYLMKACSKETTEEIMKKTLIKLGDKLSSKIAGNAIKSVANTIAKFSPLEIVFFITDFIYGFDNADTLLGVAKGDEYTINFGQKCLCGLLNLINNRITLGLIPTETIVDIIIEYLFPLFGLDAESLNAARERSNEILDAWNAEHPEETYTNLEDFNNKDKWTTKVKKSVTEWAGNTWDKVKTGTSNAWKTVKNSKAGQWVSNAATKTKEMFTKAGTAISEGVTKVADTALDIGTFIKDVTTNVIKYAINPDNEWSIDDYIKEDDPLGGAKKIIYNVLKIPLGVIGVVTKIGTSVYNAIKGFVVDVKDGFGDAWQDIKAVGTGQYTVFSSEYWKFNDKDEGDNPLGIISKISSTVLKVMSMPHAMIGYVGSKAWEGIKKLIDGAKEGAIDASSDIKAVTTGQYTIFNKDYWKSDNEDSENSLSTLGSIFGFVTRLFSAPSAMMGYVGSKIWKGFKTLISGAKEGVLDASSDIKAVVTGQYTIFNKDYWKSDNEDPENPLSTIGNIFGFVTRLFSAPKAMMGYVGSKAIQGIKAMIDGAKEGALDASSDVNAVKNGEYTIFSKDYWKSDNEDPENPLSKIGSIFSFMTRLFQAPSAMMGWVGTKVKKVFTDMIANASEGLLDASEDVAAVKKGEYTIFSKDYWKSNNDDSENPLSTIGNIAGFITRLFQAPSAMMGWVGTKVKKVFTDMIEGVTDINKDTDNAIKRAKNGEISVFGKEYWKINIDEDNPLGGIGKVIGFIQRLFNAPVVLIQRAFNGIAEQFEGVWDWFKGLFGENTSSTAKAGSKRHGGNRNDLQANGDHIYQSNSAIANIRYGNSTIGEAGCAPVAATNLINNMTGSKKNITGNLAEAASFAENGGYTVSNGGTDIRYFNTYLASKGISTVNTSNKKTALEAIKSGKQVVLLGQDGYNNGAPYGTNPHFITATGVAPNGNIIVEDPDLPESRVEYKPQTLMKSMISSVVTNTGGNRKYMTKARNKTSALGKAIKKIYYGRGNQLGANAIINVAKSQVGVIESPVNQVKYNHAYYERNVNGESYPWCVAFVWWVFNQAGASKLFYDGKRTASCSTLIDHYKKLGKVDKNPQIGDIVFFNFDGGSSAKHTGIISGVSEDGKSITTIEGNTGQDNSNGGKVMQRTRSMSVVVGCAHIDYPYEYDDSSVIDMSKYGDNTDYKSIALSGTSVSTNNAGDTIFTKISNLANSVFKAKYGENAYQLMFGNTGDNSSTTGASTTSGAGLALTGGKDSEKIWNYLRSYGYTAAGAAGLMGNLQAESSLNSNNLQDTYETSLGYTDDAYTSAVNSKSYSKNKFINDTAGYGIAQWTFNSRKKDLYENTVENGIGIGDLGGQLQFLTKEINRDYPKVDSLLRTTANVNSASDTILTDFENPKVKNFDSRRSYSQSWYDKYKNAGSGRKSIGDARTISRSNGYNYGGNATYALSRNSAYADYSVTSPNTSRSEVSTNSTGVDYETFLRTIITVLMQISDNTTLLNSILDILSKNFNLNISKEDVAKSANSRARAQEALNRAVQESGGASNMSNIINNRDTQYILQALQAIARE